MTKLSAFVYQIYKKKSWERNNVARSPKATCKWIKFSLCRAHTLDLYEIRFSNRNGCCNQKIETRRFENLERLESSIKKIFWGFLTVLCKQVLNLFRNCSRGWHIKDFYKKGHFFLDKASNSLLKFLNCSCEGHQHRQLFWLDHCPCIISLTYWCSSWNYSGINGLKNNLLLKYWLLLYSGQRTCLKLYSTATSYDKPSFGMESQ